MATKAASEPTSNDPPCSLLAALATMTGESKEPATTGKLRVLLVEDTPANQMLVTHVLNKQGHKVEVASNGHEAVRLAAQGSFDLILMDVQMPEMDGLQATAAIRALPSRPRVPIVAMTAFAMPGDRERCLAAGMDEYLAKPLDVRKLKEVMESLLRPRVAGSKPR